MKTVTLTRTERIIVFDFYNIFFKKGYQSLLETIGWESEVNFDQKSTIKSAKDIFYRKFVILDHISLQF